MDQVELLSLLDEVLLSVLAYLTPHELLKCRVLCRRLRDLCLHRQLWSRVTVETIWTKDARLLRAALNLAPCLRLIRCSSKDVANLAFLVQGTVCVVAELHLFVRNQEDAALASLIVVKLSAVGGLRKLKLNLGCPSSASNLPTLLKAVLSLNQTVELSVTMLMMEPVVLPDVFYDLEIVPCLTKLTYQSRHDDPFLLLLLRANAASLQDIWLDPRLKTVIAQLAAVPNLRTLTCSASDGLSALVNLANLQDITLIIESPHPSPGALQFLREASQLRTVMFDGQFKTAAAHLLALAQSPSAARIKKIRDVYVTPDLVQSVAPVLEKFPSLILLRIESLPQKGLLKAISPESLPNLTSLVVNPLKLPDQCLHSWLHNPAIQDLLVRNSRLHLRLCEPIYVKEDCECGWCDWGCHVLLRSGGAYSSHARNASCPADCFQMAGGTGQ